MPAMSLVDQPAPLFTIVMCVHATEDFVADAVRSIRAQSCDDWELLVVDDGCRDHSVLRVLRAAEDDPRVRLIHDNSWLGLSEARDRSLANARGRYVAFFDCEDTAEPTYLEVAARAINVENPDIVVEGLQEDFFNRRGEVAYSEDRVPERAFLTGPAVQTAVLGLEERGLMGAIFTKFFRRELVQDIKFESGGEPYVADFFFTLEAIEKAQSIALLPEAPYHYEKHIRGERQATLTTGTFLQRNRRTAAIQDHQQRYGLDTPESRNRLGTIYTQYVLDELGRLTDLENYIPKEEQEKWVAFLHEDPLFQMLVVDAEPTPGLLKSLFHKALTSSGSSAPLALAHLRGYLKSFGPETFSRSQE